MVEERKDIRGVLRVQRQTWPRCKGGECGHVRTENNRTRVLSGQDVPSKNHSAGAPRRLAQVAARGGSARAQREEEGAPSLACV